MRDKLLFELIPEPSRSITPAWSELASGLVRRPEKDFGKRCWRRQEWRVVGFKPDRLVAVRSHSLLKFRMKRSIPGTDDVGRPDRLIPGAARDGADVPRLRATCQNTVMLGIKSDKFH